MATDLSVTRTGTGARTCDCWLRETVIINAIKMLINGFGHVLPSDRNSLTDVLPWRRQCAGNTVKQRRLSVVLGSKMLTGPKHDV